jgi:hypothetical protein
MGFDIMGFDIMGFNLETVVIRATPWKRLGHHRGRE